MLACLCLYNRNPLDIVESESEIVHGIATELGGFSFVATQLIDLIHIVIFSSTIILILEVGLITSLSVLNIIIIALTVIRCSVNRIRLDILLSYVMSYGVPLICMLVLFVC